MKTAKYDGIALNPKKDQDYVVGQSQSSAYADRPDRSTSGIVSLEVAIERLCEGGYAIDLRHLSWEEACQCISGPMLDVKLPPLTLHPMLSENVSFHSKEAFLEFEKDMVGRSVAYLSMDLYAEWWRQRGARIGRKVNGQMVWEN